MTTLMQQALQEWVALPDSDQDRLARLLLDTIQDEREWDRQFAASRDVLEELADEALAAYEAGHTTRLS